MIAASSKNVFIGLLLASVVMGGCATQQGNEQLRGAGVGMTGGAVLGCLIGLAAAGGKGCATGAAIGAAAGLVAGWGAVKISQYRSTPVRSAQDDRRMYGMTPAVDKAQVKIRQGTATPKAVQRGGQVKLVTDYSLTLPSNMSSTGVTERWILRKDGRQLADLPTQNQRSPGGWAAEATIPIPKDADPGTYVIEHKVQAGTSYDTDESTFVVSG